MLEKVQLYLNFVPQHVHNNIFSLPLTRIKLNYSHRTRSNHTPLTTDA